MPWIWINPASEPSEMVEAADRVVQKPSNTINLEESHEEYSEADAGFDIADVYNQVEAIGVYPKQVTPNAEPYFTH
jgi:flagellar basal body P-ring protein FlgI